MKKVIPLIVLVVVAGIAAAAYEFFRNGSERESKVIQVSGNIEVTAVELSFRIPGWLERRAVSEGAKIKEGDVIAELDRTELSEEVGLREAEVRGSAALVAELESGSRPEEIARAASALDRAKALVVELESGSRPEEIGAAEAAHKAAGVEAQRLKLDFERMKQLEESGAATTQELDRARAAYEAASEREREAGERLKLAKEGPRKEEIERARAAAKEAEATWELAKQGPRKEEVERARAQLEGSRRALAIAQTRLGWTVLKSPVTGVVLSKNAESGEFVGAGTPIVTVADMTTVWLRAYVNEGDLGRVKVGQAVEVRTDTYPEKVYSGRVSFISEEAEFTPKSVETRKERVKLVYRIKVEIDNPAQELKAGMPADARILSGE